ncbi:MAG TPA: DUF6084 family protein [Bryobacteraceae bacterium]|nr:DUF6084 family protein [Bryobacteraceae bacterium]
MRAVTIQVTKAEAFAFSAAPMIAFELLVSSGEAIESVALRAQIMIEPARRSYSRAAQDELSDLFGEPERWSRTLNPLLWTHAATNVPAFSGSIRVKLPVGCTFDFNLASTKYFHAVREGGIPLRFHFSGTIFYRGADGGIQIAPVPWDRESPWQLSASVWHDMMDHYYPDGAWLRLRRDVFERLYAFKRHHGIATWEEAIDRLIPLSKEAVS